jgi:predicted lipid-binding transport protein (Tim44 family)
MWDGMEAWLTDPNPGDAWAPRDLAIAHENVHYAISSENAQKFADGFKAAVEALSAACKDGDASVVKGIEDAHKALEEEFTIAELRNKDHKPKERFLAATSPIARKWLAKIREGMEIVPCPNIPPLPPE